MAKQKRLTDMYTNRAFGLVTMSAANTITFEQLRFAVGTFTGVGLLLHRVEYFPTLGTYNEVVAAADSFQMGLVSRNDLTALNPIDNSIISIVRVNAVGVAVESKQDPIIQDFTNLPEKGLLIPPNPLYLAMNSTGFAAAGEFRCIMYYSFVELTDQQSIEMLQTIIPGNV